MDTLTSRHRLPVRPADACCEGAVDRPAPRPPSLDMVRAEALAERLKALADPTRLRMLDLLAQQAEELLPAEGRLLAIGRLPAEHSLCVCDVTAQFPQNQPTISHHLKLLRSAGLVECERRGVWAYYWATDAGREALSLVKGLG
jgi:ArsR family transcriptional regulator, arsenate/arsenite/antimonite-responsive transcriptional repressor